MGKTYAFRLRPGNDLKEEIQSYVNEKGIMAGWIACGIGSLTNFNIRFANAAEGTKGRGYFEIVSLMGTVSVAGSHIHISISDSSGKTIGGHLLDGNFVYTTAEVVIQEADDLVFSRELDEVTGWKELKVKKGRK